MKCNNCNQEFEQEFVFCPNCGARLIDNVIDIIDEEVKEEVESGPWRGFARVGHILGTIAIPTFWIISLGLAVGVFGIVFSAMGKKSKSRRSLAEIGFKSSLIGSILSLGFITLIYIIASIIRFFY